MTPDLTDQHTNSIEVMKKAIFYRAHHRGTKEADWLIGGFVRQHLNDFSEAEIRVLKQLVDMDDESFFNQIDDPQQDFQAMVDTFRRYKKSL